MAHMLAKYDTKVHCEIKKSGTAQTDGEYEQAMTQWKARVESVDFYIFIRLLFFFILYNTNYIYNNRVVMGIEIWVLEARK